MRLKLHSVVLGVLVVGVYGCTGTVNQADSKALSELCSVGRLGQAITSTGPVAPGCSKIEGTQIGRNPTLKLDGATVEISGWVRKEGSPGEYIGFSYISTGKSVAYAVKAGTATYAGTSSPWLHPEGGSAHAISNVTFCPAEPPGGGSEEGEDAGSSDPDGGYPTPPAGGECPNPDDGDSDTAPPVSDGGTEASPTSPDGGSPSDDCCSAKPNLN